MGPISANAAGSGTDGRQQGGCRVGANWQRRSPSRPPCGDTDHAGRARRGRARRPVLGDSPAGARGTPRHHELLKDEALIREYQVLYTRPGHRRTVARMVAAWSHALADVAAGLSRIRCPVLLLWGLRDRYIFPWNPHGERFLRDLPQARAVQLPDAGHFLQVERPAEVVRHPADFLSVQDKG